MHIFEDKFEVRFATSPVEIEESQKLRYVVFIEEMGGCIGEQENEIKLEADKFDNYCRHLLLIDRSKKSELLDGKVVGVIRLMLGSEAELGIGFCSSEEYDLRLLLNSGKKCLELSRTCIDIAYRNSLALHYLWSGLGTFSRDVGVDLLFGLASFPGNDVSRISMALSFIHERYLAPKGIRPKALNKGCIDMDIVKRNDIDKLQALRQMPSLIKSYFRLGAKVGEGAFRDKILNTIDVCILIDVITMTGKYRDYYGKS